MACFVQPKPKEKSFYNNRKLRKLKKYPPVKPKQKSMNNMSSTLLLINSLTNVSEEIPECSQGSLVMRVLNVNSGPILSVVLCLI